MLHLWRDAGSLLYAATVCMQEGPQLTLCCKPATDASLVTCRGGFVGCGNACSALCQLLGEAAAAGVCMTAGVTGCCKVRCAPAASLWFTKDTQIGA